MIIDGVGDRYFVAMNGREVENHKGNKLNK